MVAKPNAHDSDELRNSAASTFFQQIHSESLLSSLLYRAPLLHCILECWHQRLFVAVIYFMLRFCSLLISLIQRLSRNRLLVGNIYVNSLDRRTVNKVYTKVCEVARSLVCAHAW